ncbi:hypothetical protein Dimus_023206, partial [Dionaea muscipula]
DVPQRRVKKLLAALQGEFGGPDFEPHITFIGAIWQTEEEVLQKFHAAVKGLKPVPVVGRGRPHQEPEEELEGLKKIVE